MCFTAICPTVHILVKKHKCEPQGGANVKVSWSPKSQICVMLYFLSFYVHVGSMCVMCSWSTTESNRLTKRKERPAVMAVHSQSLSSVADVLLQSQRTSARSSSTLWAPTTTVLQLRRLRPGLSKVHLVKLHDTCCSISGGTWEN